MTPPVGHAERLREADAWEANDDELRVGTRDEDGFHPAHDGDVRDVLAAALDEVATLRAERDKFRLEHANVEFLCKQALRKVNDQDAELVALRAERDRLRAALTEHAIQCPQCHDVAVRAALTPSPEGTTNG